VTVASVLSLHHTNGVLGFSLVWQLQRHGPLWPFVGRKDWLRVGPLELKIAGGDEAGGRVVFVETDGDWDMGLRVYTGPSRQIVRTVAVAFDGFTDFSVTPVSGHPVVEIAVPVKLGRVCFGIYLVPAWSTVSAIIGSKTHMMSLKNGIPGRPTAIDWPRPVEDTVPAIELAG